jgi:hypothetical protein
MGRRIKIIIGITIVAVVLIVTLTPEWSSRHDEASRVQAIAGTQAYDFVTWEVETVLGKLETALLGSGRFLEQDEQKATVLHFIALVSEARRLQGDVERAYAAGDEQEAGLFSAELATIRTELESIQPITESILESQVATLLAEEGFAFAGYTLPPVSGTMTPLPSMLIVSPRDEIRRIYSFPLKHGLTIAEQEALEREIEEQLGYSALVVPIGGLGIYPAMIFESSNLNWLAETFAHEWAHHWLTFRPLGAQFLLPSENIEPAVWTMNETTASVVGTEIGTQLIARYYPELVPPPAPPATDDGDLTQQEPPSFDYRAEMRETREEVDRLLLLDDVESAETYMETRRQFFVANGYTLRKLNQAYFAFYGAYADEPGATGGDPVGPLVLELRENSDSLRDFMDTISPLTSFDQLENAVENSP